MRLTSYTDYSLRTLMFLADHRDRLVTIAEIAETHGIAKNHLTKVVNNLGSLGYIETLRGRNGGLRLGREPADINIGAVVRQTESDFFMAACFDAESSGCIYTGQCNLQGTLGAATQAFLAVLDGATLEGMLRPAKTDVGDTGQPVQLHFKPPRRA